MPGYKINGKWSATATHTLVNNIQFNSTLKQKPTQVYSLPILMIFLPDVLQIIELFQFLPCLIEVRSHVHTHIYSVK